MTHQGIFTDSQNPRRAVPHIHLPVMSTRAEGMRSPSCKSLHSLGLSGCAVTVISKHHTNVLRKSYKATDGFLTQNIIHCKRGKNQLSEWNVHALRDSLFICPPLRKHKLKTVKGVETGSSTKNKSYHYLCSTEILSIIQKQNPSAYAINYVKQWLNLSP